MISLRLFSSSGSLIPNQLLLKTAEASDTDLFVSIWNHTDQPQSLGLLTLLNYQLIEVEVDNREKTHLFLFSLAPNESIEIPIRVPTAGLSRGLQQLTFLVVRRPNAFAAEDLVAGSLCCFLSQHSLWIGEQPMPRYDVLSAAGGLAYAFGLYPSPHAPLITTPQNADVSVQFRVKTELSWRLVVLVDYQQTAGDLAEPIGQSEDWRSVSIRIPGLASGRHEVLAIFVTDPGSPVTDGEGHPVQQGGWIVRRFTLAAK
jgi:hypothetical protein